MSFDTSRSNDPTYLPPEPWDEWYNDCWCCAHCGFAAAWQIHSPRCSWVAERKVISEVDGVVYRGRHSVRISAGRIWIDGKEVGVEIDKDGNPLDRTPKVSVEPAVSWWRRWLGLGGSTRG